MSEDYHIPVLLKETIEGLNIDPNGIYVDVTFGGGGHSREILKYLDKGTLIVFDQDQDAYENRPKDDRLVFVRHNFRYLKNFLRFLGVEKVDGILADLGVSSHHFDTPERGFSFRFEGALDMRMSQGMTMTAADVINTYSEEALFKMFKFYGELKKLGGLVREILQARTVKKFQTIEDLKVVAEKYAPKREQSKYLAQVFQALRIEVNQEMDVLKEMLMQTKEVLAQEGRLVVISYHSLEDRLVKNFIKTGSCEKTQVEQDFFGNKKLDFKAVNRKLIVPGEEEIGVNNRARSAKLRIAEKL